MNNGHFQVKLKFVWENSVQKRRKYQEMKTRVKFDGPSILYPLNGTAINGKISYCIIGQRPTSLFDRNASTAIALLYSYCVCVRGLCY